MRAPNMHLLQELIRLHRLGLGGRQVAARLGISPNTERKYRRPLGAAGLGLRGVLDRGVRVSLNNAIK